MQQQRIQFLENLYQSDTNDPFNGYALAMEYLKTDALKATALLFEVKQKHPKYLPSYYQLATLLIDTAAYEEAQLILNEGIALAIEQDNTKTLNELKALLHNLEMES